jgi:hypothetical protein
MKIEGIVWLRDIVEKLAWKHEVEPYEVEEVFANQPKIRFKETIWQKIKLNSYLLLIPLMNW